MCGIERGVGLWLTMFLCACGSRTGLDVRGGDAGPRADAGVDAGRRDGGFFATFPCRWSLGLPLDLGEGLAFEGLTGAVHPSLDEAVLFANRVGTDSRVGGRVGIAATPTLLHDLSRDGVESGELLTGVSGYARLVGSRCITSNYDGAFEFTGTVMWGRDPPLSRCDVTQARPGQLVSVNRGSVSAARIVEIDGIGGGVLVEREVTTIDGELSEGFAVRDERAGTTLIAYRIGERAYVERHGAGRRDRYPYPGRVSSIGAVPDPLRGGMLVLHEERSRGWSLDWVPPDRDAPQRLIALDTLPAPPAGPLAGNETEALIPLANGQMAYIPLALSTLRLLEPVDGADVVGMRVILRPGTSGGGLLFTQATPRGERLRFQPLVCNR